MLNIHIKPYYLIIFLWFFHNLHDYFINKNESRFLKYLIIRGKMLFQKHLFLSDKTTENIE